MLRRCLPENLFRSGSGDARAASVAFELVVEESRRVRPVAGCTVVPPHPILLPPAEKGPQLKIVLVFSFLASRRPRSP